MSSEIGRRLTRLAESGVCTCENDFQHKIQLKKSVEEIISTVEASRKSKFFKALADVTRLRILGLLSIREMCVCEIMVALDLTQPTASHHLRILENVGLIKDRKKGKWVFYALTEPTNVAKLLSF